MRTIPCLMFSVCLGISLGAVGLSYDDVLSWVVIAFSAVIFSYHL